MKGKQYSTEEKIRILREVEAVDKSILQVCKDKGISEQTFHRWKREFGIIQPSDRSCPWAQLKYEFRLHYPKVQR